MADKDYTPWMKSIIEKNKDKNFVDRIKNVDKYPDLDLGNGWKATHKMSYAEVAGKYLVYPNVVYVPTTNSLMELKPKDAFDWAVKNNEFIKFDSQKEADYFSKNYKKLWEK